MPWGPVPPMTAMMLIVTPCLCVTCRHCDAQPTAADAPSKRGHWPASAVTAPYVSVHGRAALGVATPEATRLSSPEAPLIRRRILRQPERNPHTHARPQRRT